MKAAKKEPSRHIVDILFVLTLFGVFAASALMLVTIGANVYKKTVTNMNGHFTDRTASSYLTEKIRQCDLSNGVSIGELNGQPALIFSENIGEEEFCTYIYLYEGQLKELFTRKSTVADDSLLAAGQNIIALSGFLPEKLEDNLIRITLTTDSGDVITLYAALRSDNS